jgi:hypothetical protein
VEVTSEPPVVDSARGSQAGVIEERSINELSIDRRDYLTFLRFLAWDHLTGLFKQNLKDLKRLFLQPDLGPVPTQFSRLEINFERSEANYSARCIGTLHLTNSTPTLAETASGRPFGTGGRVLWRFYAKPVRT